MSEGGVHGVRHLIEATGYAQWHRLLFARFLAERSLLRHPEHGPVTMEDCEELASLEGFADAWMAAESYGARMLPGVFQPDDPVLALRFAPEHAHALRALMDSLDPATFQAEDALGWTYQFWRASEKDRVNKSGEKIGARDLPAVTQLFTEPYMVKFLLHNTLGAWRAGKVLAAQPNLAANAPDEATLRAAVSPRGYAFDMLRFVRDGEVAPRWRPAAGNFPGWPQVAAEIRALDPCCGSGHFLTEMLAILSALRADEEGLADAAAVGAVLRDNLFGLELDGRCVQIAAFAVALAAWRIGGFQPFGREQVHIAWVGSPPPLDRVEFLALANGDEELRHGLEGLHELFVQAPLLGSLIDPTGGDLMSPQRLGRIEPLLERLVERTRAAEPERVEGATAAKGMADAAAILSRRYTLVATNVPYLVRGKQEDALREFSMSFAPEADQDLATVFLKRCHSLSVQGGTYAVVSPNNWLFIKSYKIFRSKLLETQHINIVARIGSGATAQASWDTLRALTIITRSEPTGQTPSFGLSTDATTEQGRALDLLQRPIVGTTHEGIGRQPDQRIVYSGRIGGRLLSEFADSLQGPSTGDFQRFGRLFHEIPTGDLRWELQQSTIVETSNYCGCRYAVKWENGSGELSNFEGAAIRGVQAIGQFGVVVTQMRSLPCSLFAGRWFDNNVAVLVPRKPEYLGPIWAYCSSDEYGRDVRGVDEKLGVTNASLGKVVFDEDRWNAVFAEKYDGELPSPGSDDPTEWLFHGHPAQARSGTKLHVALARLAGFRWPAEKNPAIRLSAEARQWIEKAATLPSADNDGLLCLEAVAGEQPLAQRLRAYLATAFAGEWSASLESTLIAEADQAAEKGRVRDGTLEAWLRDRAFRQHCRLFRDRPFLWQIWDGTKDGFSAFLHYHRLDSSTLSKLTYTILGDWIARMTNAGDTRRVEAARTLQQKLTAILGGEAPLDIFVRWKPLEHQPVGWDPDIDDGVRLNIRPFVEAGVLRETPKIKWGVDRGGDVASAPWFPLDRGKRNNDRHLTLAEKHAALGQA